MLTSFLKLTTRQLFNQTPIYKISTNFNKIFTDKHLKEFQENGATIVENVATEEQVDQLIKQCKHIMSTTNYMDKRVCFSMGEVEIAKSFIESGDQIGFFFEPNVFDENNKLKVPEDQVLNKMGHALHDLDPVFEKFTYRPLLQYILKQIGYKKPQCIQSMYIFKNPGVGTPVPPHTDNTYLITEPKSSAVGFWFALHDATIENGCMWGINGSHKFPATHHMNRNDTNDMLFYIGKEKPYDVEQAVPIQVKKGSMFIFHGDYVHMSKDNPSILPRHAYTVHFIDTDGHKWHEKNWLQRRPHLPFRDYDSVVSKLYPTASQSN